MYQSMAASNCTSESSFSCLKHIESDIMMSVSSNDVIKYFGDIKLRRGILLFTFDIFHSKSFVIDSIMAATFKS